MAKKKAQMLYYRYRAPTETSFKELLYNEIYFSSPIECNDPFDGRTYFEFHQENDKWKQLLMFAWNNSEPIFRIMNVDKAAEALSDYCPLTYEFALSNDFGNLLTNIFAATLTSKNVDVNLILEAVQRVVRVVNLYKMRTTYFVSFSKCNNEQLLWSHYAGKHEGYCLVFKPIKGQLA